MTTQPHAVSASAQPASAQRGASPTRVALISDIHGNLVALDAVLRDIAARGVSQIVCLGDIALSGPQPHACVARIRTLGCPTAMGNCDALALRQRREGATPAVMAAYTRFGAWVAAIDLWSAQALTDDDAAWLTALPLTTRVALAPDATLLCAHGSPQSFTHRLLADSEAQSDERLAELVGPVTATVLASGHTHLPMRRRLGALTIVNPGSVGLPLETNAGRIVNPAGYAEYGILTWAPRAGAGMGAGVGDEAGGGADALSWEPLRVALDEATVRAAALASGMPHADRWRGDWTQP